MMSFRFDEITKRRKFLAENYSMKSEKICGLNDDLYKMVPHPITEENAVAADEYNKLADEHQEILKLIRNQK